ncbi:MAG TPA: hypothetical protein VIJ18_10565 [Microbacteriaceae bacterium]
MSNTTANESAAAPGSVTRHASRRVWAYVLFPLAALALGVLIALVKGEGGGIRYDIGNLAAPWLVLPFFCGRLARRPAYAVVVGAVFGAFLALLAIVLQRPRSPTLRHASSTPR